MIMNPDKGVPVGAGNVVSASVAEAQNYVISSGTGGISNYARWGDDLIVEFSSGGILRINNFFINGPSFHKLMLVDNGAHIHVDFSHAIVNSGDGIEDKGILYQPVSESLSVGALLGILGGAAAGVAGIVALARDNDKDTSSSTSRPDRPGVAAKDDNDPDADDPAVIANEGFTNDSTPMLDGAGAVPGGKIAIRINGGEPVFVTVNEDGTWSYTLPKLDDGEYDIRITQTDRSGRVSDETSLKFTVDTKAPDVPVLEKVVDNVSPDAPGAPEDGEIKKGSVTNDATPTLSGTGEPGAVIKIYDGDKVVGSGIVDKDGKWSVELKEPLSDGHHQLQITATDKAGNESEKSSPPFEIEIDTKLPGQFDLRNIEIYNDMSDGPIEKNKDGEWITSSRRPVFKGKVGGVEDAVWVEIIDTNNRVVDTVKVNEDGTWSWQPDSDLNTGWRNYQFRAVDAAGNRGPMTKSPPINIGGSKSHDAYALDPQHSGDNGEHNSLADSQHSENTDDVDDGKGDAAPEPYGAHIADTARQVKAPADIWNGMDETNERTEDRQRQEARADHAVSGENGQIHDSETAQAENSIDTAPDGQDNEMASIEISDLFPAGLQAGEMQPVSSPEFLAGERVLPLSNDFDLDMAVISQQIIV